MSARSGHLDCSVPFQVLAADYPTPELETSAPFLQAAALSAKLREAPRPERPLKVVIAGAGENSLQAQHFEQLLSTIPASPSAVGNNRVCVSFPR